MTGKTSFWRKVSYIAAMAILLVPLSWVSRPATRDREGRISEGGVLSQLRRQYGLSQAELGEIDPASESMKLATLGMRGVAANILWEKAHHYKKTENWDALKATLNQITKLQPNFISVWQFQAWNLSYNVSVEFDDYRQRYHWVKKGIDFLVEGTQYNRHEPRLLWDIGWFFGHKIGKSDEKVQFRRMFRDDTDFHRGLPIPLDQAAGPDGRPDNWLVSREWYLAAQRIVDTQGVPIKGKNPLIFHSDPAMALMKYAEAIEEEGYLDEKAQYAWMRAGQAWHDYGDREIPTSFGYDIRLNDGEKMHAEALRMTAQLDEAAIPREVLREELRATLRPEERQALDMPLAERTPLQHTLAIEAAEKLMVSHQQVAERAPRERHAEALRLAKRIVATEEQARTIDRYRDIVNFVYWRTRCEAEQQDEAIRARRFVYEADRAYEAADLEGARRKYEDAWEEWAKIFAQHPSLMEDTTAEDLMESVHRYRELLGQLDEAFPPPGFKLAPLLALHEKDLPPTPDGRPPAQTPPDADDPAADQPEPAQPPQAPPGDDVTVHSPVEVFP